MHSHVPTIQKAYVSLRIGKWLVARATGWGVLTLPFLIAVVCAIGRNFLR